MKSAEEFVDQDLKFAMLSMGGGAAYEFVKARDLAMWKQGMTDAAALSTDSVNDTMYVFVPNIIAHRDHTKSL